MSKLKISLEKNGDEIHESNDTQLLCHQISKDISKLLQFKSFHHEVQTVGSSEEVNLENFKESLVKEIRKCKLDSNLRNFVFHWLKDRGSLKNEDFKKTLTEPLDYLKKSQANWEEILWKSLTSMAKEVKLPLSRGRLNSEQEMVRESWHEISQWDIDLGKFKPVYSPKDFLDWILQIESPNYNIKGAEHFWSLLSPIPIKVKSLQQLREFYAELSEGEIHSVLVQIHEDEKSYEIFSPFTTFLSQRSKLGDLENENSSVVQEFLKKGCMLSNREKLWQIVLGSQLTVEHKNYYEELKESVMKADLLIDRITLKDVQLTGGNDDEYFVFEDSLYQVLLCFTRDLSLLDLIERSSKSLHFGTAKKPRHPSQSSSSVNQNSTITVVYPPNGILPFHGFTMYVAPLCYLYDDPMELYFTFRSIYSRYWYRLHEISSHPNGILSLSILFEKLIHRHETELWLHLRALRVLPLRIIFKWLMKAYSGYLPAEQVLQLWDIVLAFDSLEILPLFALGVLRVRKFNLMKAQSVQTVDAILADLSSISVLPTICIALA